MMLRSSPLSGLPALLALLALQATAASSCAPTPSPGLGADLLVLGGSIVTMDPERRVLEDGGIAVLDGRIVDLGPAAELRQRWRATETVHAGPRDLVIPGLINGHNHAAMTLMRGMADDLALMEWLQSYIFPAEAETVDAEFVRAGTELAALEMIRTGTTTFVDMYYFEDVVAQVVDETGLRAILGETVIDFPVPDHATPEEALSYTAQFMERWKDHPRIIATVAPHAPFTVAPEILQRCAELAREHGVPILIHLAETSDEVDQIQERYGLSPTSHLAGLGFLGPDVVAAHAVWLQDDDIETLAANGVGVVHNPESNMKLASGTMRIAALQQAGVAVGIGTDGAASNNDLDLFSALLIAALLQKHAAADPTVLPAASVIAMATIEGARAIGLETEIGSLELGKRADIVIVDGDAPNLVPRYSPYSHLVYAAHGSNVRATIVEGRVLYLDGEFRTLDPVAIRAAARTMARRVAAAVNWEE